MEKEPFLFVEASPDPFAPTDKTTCPLWEKQKNLSAPVSYQTIVSTHSFAGQRMTLAKIVAKRIEKTANSLF